MTAEDYREAIGNEEGLASFLRSMQRFDRLFCELMGNHESEFTIKLEVHGASGKLIHCRVTSSSMDRPKAPKG